MQTLSDELLAQIVQRLVDALHPLEIWLFGSHASGKTHKHSDIDLLLVVADDAGDLHELAMRGYRALRHMGISKDLALFHQRQMTEWSGTPSTLPYQAIRQGRLLYAARPQRRATVA